MNVLAMSDLAICIENYILSAGEGLSKLYPAHSLWAGCIGAFQRRPDTLRDALTDLWPRITRISRKNNSSNSSNSWPKTNSSNLSNSWQENTIWALKDVSFEVKRREVVGILAPALRASVIGRPTLRFGIPCGHNSAGTLAPARRAGESTLLKIPSRITEPTSGRAETCGGRVGSLLDAAQGHRLAWRPRADRPGEHPLRVNGATLCVGMRRHEIDRKFDRIVAFAETPS